jgi:sugar lactone lactonase YvrE
MPARRRRHLLWVGPLLSLALAAAALWWVLARPASVTVDPRRAATTRVLAGDGVPGVRDGDASEARFSDPFGVAAAADGTVYVADAGEAQRIRRISPDGRVSTVAGGHDGFADGVGEAAQFSSPSGLAIDAGGTLYVADTGNNAIRRIAPDGRVSTLAGDGVAGDRDGPALQARFNGPIGVAVDAAGRIIVADTYNDRVRAIDPDGTVRTLAGANQPGTADGVGAQARLHTPCGVAIDVSGRIHVADTGNGLVRTITPGGLVTTRVPTTVEYPFRPVGITVNAAGDAFVTDERGRVVEIAADGSTRTIAGAPTAGFRDGAGSDARFRRPAVAASRRPDRGRWPCGMTIGEPNSDDPVPWKSAASPSPRRGATCGGWLKFGTFRRVGSACSAAGDSSVALFGHPVLELGQR